MPAWLRAGLFAALFVFAAAPLNQVQSAEKTFQDAALDSTRSVVDNVIEGVVYVGGSRNAAKDRAAQLLDKFAVTVDGRRRPGQISGGQAQRVALCRALLNNPTNLLADEPTGNLDDRNAQLVMGALREAATGGCAAIVATHDRSLLDLCDRHVELGT